MRRLVYTIALLATEKLGLASQWLWDIVTFWLRHPLGFVVAPLALIVWAPIRLIFEMTFHIFFFWIIPRFPIEERLQAWPNR